MSLLKHTKKEIQEIATVEAMDVIESGSENVMQMYLDSMAQSEYYQAMAKALHESAMQEFEDYGEKEVEIYGRRISKFEAGVKYDFSNCGHIGLTALETEIKMKGAMVKAFKDQIKHIQEPQQMISEDGEVFEVKPPTKTSTTKLKLIY